MNIPNYITALDNMSLLNLEEICLTNQELIENWFNDKWLIHKAPFYGSVDLRNSSYKLSPVDMNLFPGGFNNIDCISLAVDAIKTNKDYGKVLLIPENHTRNQSYLKNVYTLQSILEQAGVECKIGSLALDKIQKIIISDNQAMIYYPLIRNNNIITTTDGFVADAILLNNDLSSGKPDILDGISQKLLVPLNAGWYIRQKTTFFSQYDIIANEFAKLVNIDPWRINACFERASNIDFSTKIGLEELANKVDIVFDRIKANYKEHKLESIPYIIVKANNGTYGMGIMVVKSSQDILNINRKSRNKMAVIKDSQVVNDVIIQEGVHTFERIENNKVAEPVVYMLNNNIVGAFYRAHPEKDDTSNLNAVGASFIPMKFSNKPMNRFYAYSVVARLSLLASSMELSLL